MNREICDVKQSIIKDADELWVYCHQESKFRKINRIEYPKPKGTICSMCPNGAHRTSDSIIHCQTKVETWSTFKAHLVTVERIYGELVAFPADLEEAQLPPVENYKLKHRAYGQLGDYQETELFYLYDVKQAKFIHVQRSMLSKLYTKNGLCAYCPCIRKIQSPSSIIQHLQSIENKFYCFLVLDNQEQNDRRNNDKIMNFVNSVKENQSIEGGDMRSSSCSRTNCLKYIDEEERSQSSEYLSINEENEPDNTKYAVQEENLISVLNQMEKSFRNECKKIEPYFYKLKNKANTSSLNQSVINSQEQMTLIKRNEDCQTNETNLTFAKKLNLDAEDLALLMKRYGVPKSYRIRNAEINLNLKLRPKSHLNGLSNSPTKGNDEIRALHRTFTPNASYKVKQESDSEDEENLLNLNRLRGAHF